MQAIQDAKPMLQKFLTEEDFTAVPMAIATAYQACGRFMRHNVVTSTFPVGMEKRALLLSAFVEHSLMRMADERAAMLADQADAETRRTGRVRLNYSRAGETLVVHFPDGTDLWKVLKRCDEWSSR